MIESLARRYGALPDQIREHDASILRHVQLVALGERE